MRMFLIELRKEKRTGAIPVLPAVGILGAFYAFANFIVGERPCRICRVWRNFI